MKNSETIVNEKTLQGLNNLFKELSFFPRWSRIYIGNKYDELSKQTLNCLICFIMAIKAKNKGFKLDFTLFPKISIFRAFQKTVNGDILEENLKEILRLSGITEKEFLEVQVYSKISEYTSEDFLEFLKVPEDAIEVRIFKAATKIATYLELDELKEISPAISNDAIEGLLFSMEKYSDVPGFCEMKKSSSPEFEFFKEASSLRNRGRWTQLAISKPLSVLGHMYDTAVFAYLISLYQCPENEELATKLFFIGIFHDLPENWTGDMKTPIKDAMPKLREGCEEFELKMLTKHVYSKLPEYIVNELKWVFMQNDNETKSAKKILKKADYLSAVTECWRLIILGSRDPELNAAVGRYYDKKENYEQPFRNLIEEIYILTKS